MVRSSAPWFVVLALGACATSPAPFVESHATRSAAVDTTTGAAVPQGGDYSVSTLFHQQHGQFMRDHRRYRDEVEASFLYQPDNRIKGEDGHFDLLQYRADIYKELEVDPDMSLIVGAVGEARRYGFSDTLEGHDGDEWFNRISARVGVNRFLADDLLVTAVFEPGVHSDLDGGPNSDDWQFFGELIGTYRAAEGLYLKVGGMVTNTFRDVPVYPVAGLVWLPTPELRVDLLLPHHVELSYNPDPAFIVSAGMSLEGDEYTTRSGIDTGKLQLEQTTQELRAYLGARYRVDDHLSFFGRAGVALAGDYKLNGSMSLAPTAADDGRSDGVLRSATFFEFGAGWTF